MVHCGDREIRPWRSRMTGPRKPRKPAVDRISKLPDTLLCHIISFLPSKEAIDTSTLSTRWRLLWTMVPALDFYPVTPSTRYSSVVNTFLSLRRTRWITRFRLTCQFQSRHDVNTWVSAAIAGKVEQLKLYLYDDISMYEWPTSLFTCGTIVVLKLGYCFNLSVPSSVHLPSLKTLHLRDKIDNNSVARLLSGCPALEVFYVKPINYYRKSFKICKPSGRNSRVNQLEINTPSLDLDIQNDFDYIQDYLLGYFQSVVKANIDITVYEDEYIHDVFKLLKALRNVGFLSLCGFTAKMKDPRTLDLPEFHNLVHLQLNLRNSGSLFLEQLLGKCPKLEVLVINKAEAYRNHYFSDSFWEDPTIVPVCLSSHLTVFEVRKYYGSKDDLQLVAYILKSAKVLKTLKIQTNDWFKWKQKLRMLKKLSKLPRRSNACQLQFD